MDVNLSENTDFDFDAIITESSQNATSAEYKSLINFTKRYRVASGNVSNIVNLSGGAYNIPDDAMPEFFKLVDQCRHKNNTIHFAEKQSDSSGLMIDLDIYQTVAERQFDNSVITDIINYAVQAIAETVVIDNPIPTYVVVTTKPNPKYCEIKGCYKDGVHILFSKLHLSKQLRKHIIRKLGAERDVLQLFSQMQLAVEPEKIIDPASASVPNLFVGNSKSGSPAYVIFNIYEVKIKNKMPLTVIEPIDRWSSTNMVAEFSLNWDGERNRIHRLSAHPDLETQDAALSPTSDEDNLELDDDQSLAFSDIDDVTAKELRKWLDILSIDRVRDYDKWCKVIFAIAHTSSKYYELAVYFSRRDPQAWNASSKAELDKLWKYALADKPENMLSYNSIKGWAMRDNPQRAEELRKTTIVYAITRHIFQENSHGTLGDLFLGKILHQMAENLFVADISPSTGSLVWLQFMVESDRPPMGQLHKWVFHTSKEPPSKLLIYANTVLPKLIINIMDEVEKRVKKTENPDERFYFGQVIKNLGSTLRQVRTLRCVKNIIAASQHFFASKYSGKFISQLDKQENLLGVGNGVLVLGKQPELITSIHNIPISQYTAVPWIPFNPANKYIMELKKAISDLFPEGEEDAMEWLMCYFASSLDRRVKKPYLVIIAGCGSNGKSFLVDMVGHVLGSHYSMAAQMNILTSGDLGRMDSPSSTLVALGEKRFVYFSESDVEQVLQTAQVKRLTDNRTTARAHYGKTIMDIELRATMVAATNHDFNIPTSDEGTWRRIKKYIFKNRFVRDPDPNDKRQIKADPKWNDTAKSNPGYQEAMLSILVEYYRKLQVVYNGDIDNIKHPTIVTETRDYRNSQDRINRFIDQCCVYSKNSTSTLTSVANFYMDWYKANINARGITLVEEIEKQLKNSRISKYIKSETRNAMVVEIRFIQKTEKPDSDGDEKWLVDHEDEQRNNSSERDTAMLKEFEQLN